jgi:hypothetical protein
MKHPKQLRNFCIWLSVVCVLCGQATAQNWRTVADGVEHAKVRREFSGKPVNFNLLRLDLRKVRLDVHHAMDMAIGTETTSSIAKRHGAFAAINAGFFRLDNSIWAGDPEGVFVVRRKLLSESIKVRAALLISNEIDQSIVNIAHIKLEPFLKIEKPDFVFNARGVNRERKKEDTVIYTPEYGRTTLTAPDGVELIVRRGKVVEISEGGSSSIPEDGYVVSATDTAAATLRTRCKVGTKMGLSLPGALMIEYFGIEKKEVDNKSVSEVTREHVGLSLYDDVVGGVPQLLKNGKIDITWEQEKASKSFVETRHPRTAVAKLNDGRFLMLTADGRTDESAGLDLYDLAKYMLELGAVDAMNLDGGGSTTMFVDGKVVNKPSDREGERKVSDAILVTLRKKLQKPKR